jgi:hypothetical protein
MFSSVFVYSCHKHISTSGSVPKLNKMQVKLLFLLLVSPMIAQQSVDLADRDALTAATNMATKKLASYYTPTEDCLGCIPGNDASDATGMQWYENG